MMPDETLRAAEDLRATHFLSVHNSKFCISNHDWDTPLRTITSIAGSASANPNSLNWPDRSAWKSRGQVCGVVDQGDVVTIPGRSLQQIARLASINASSEMRLTPIRLAAHLPRRERHDRTSSGLQSQANRRPVQLQDGIGEVVPRHLVPSFIQNSLKAGTRFLQATL